VIRAKSAPCTASRSGRHLPRTPRPLRTPKPHNKSGDDTPIAGGQRASPEVQASGGWGAGRGWGWPGGGGPTRRGAHSRVRATEWSGHAVQRLRLIERALSTRPARSCLPRWLLADDEPVVILQRHSGDGRLAGFSTRCRSRRGVTRRDLGRVHVAWARGRVHTQVRASRAADGHEHPVVGPRRRTDGIGKLLLPAGPITGSLRCQTPSCGGR
jgi:hypothetical protein